MTIKSPCAPARHRVLPTKNELARHLSEFPDKSMEEWKQYEHVANRGHANFGYWLKQYHLDVFNKAYFDLIARPDDWPAVREGTAFLT